MKKKCNICGNNFAKLFNLGDHPCADTFYNSQLKAKNAKKKPLVVGYCTCHHLSSITNISGFDRYKKYDSLKSMQANDFNYNALINKINFKPDNQYVDWVEDKIIQEFKHILNFFLKKIIINYLKKN